MDERKSEQVDDGDGSGDDDDKTAEAVQVRDDGRAGRTVRWMRKSLETPAAEVVLGSSTAVCQLCQSCPWLNPQSWCLCLAY